MKKYLKYKLVSLLNWRIVALILCDLLLLSFALFFAVILRLGGEWEPRLDTYWWLFILVPALNIPIFLNLGLYKAVLRYLDSKVVKIVFSGVLLSILVLWLILVLFNIGGFPRTSIVIYGALALIIVGGSRFIFRGLLHADYYIGEKKPVAIYGAGDAGIQLMLSLKFSREYSPVAFFDDDISKENRVINGLMVYSPDDIEDVVATYEIKNVLLAIPSVSISKHKEIITRLEKLNIFIQVIPGLNDLVQGNVKINHLASLKIEDLLGRDQVDCRADLLSKDITNKVVLVSGAGGSIGSELCRQICKKQPQHLALLEISEFALYTIHQELIASYPLIDISPILGSSLNYRLCSDIVKTHKVETIFHAAAYKHVPLVEQNICSGVYNNVFSTKNLAQVALENKVNTMVLISTDKAVRPTNVMGASKRLAELVMQSYATISDHCVFTMVRFGNVLGSSGSVIPLFKKQIEQGGPLTVTHPEITRFFMTIPEASQLVIQAGSMARGGEVFVLDMGESVKIIDLARKMIYLSGHTVKSIDNLAGDIEIVYSGLRPGEKLYEELLIGNSPMPTEHERIFCANEHIIAYEELMLSLDKLAISLVENNPHQVVSQLKILVKEFTTNLV